MRTHFSIAALIISSLVISPAFAARYYDYKHHSKHQSHQSHNNDGAVLGWLVALNKGEMAATQLALRKSDNPVIDNYARWIHGQHVQNLRQTLNVSEAIGQRPLQTHLSRSLEREGASMIQGLRSLNNKHFNRAFLNDMIAGHRAAIAKLNSLIAQVDNRRLDKQLRITRNMVAHHLERGLAIKHKLYGR